MYLRRNGSVCDVEWPCYADGENVAIFSVIWGTFNPVGGEGVHPEVKLKYL